MYTRISSDHIARMVFKTKPEGAEISEDKSSLLLVGEIVDNKLILPEFQLERHAVHVALHPELGGTLSVFTKDSGLVGLVVNLTKAKLATSENLGYHARMFIVRVDNGV